MIKVKFFNMHMNRSPNQMDNYAEDKGYMESINNLYTFDKSYTWKDIQLTCEQDYDYAAIIDCVFTQNYFDPSKTILFRCEPKLLRDIFPDYNRIIDPSKFLKVFDMNCLWGWLGLDYVSMHNNDFTKNKVLSSIISSNYGTEMHMKRLNFLPTLDRLPYFDHFGDDRGGTGVFNSLKSHKGKIESKIIGLKDYKYHYNSENSREIGYFSEKFIDALISECLIFYDGCVNMDDYFDPRCFIRIDLDDYEKSLHIIQSAIANDEWEKRIDIIKKEKFRILEKLNILDLVWHSVHGKKLYFEK